MSSSGLEWEQFVDCFLMDGEALGDFLWIISSHLSGSWITSNIGWVDFANWISPLFCGMLRIAVTL
jgi:hypothetical protein